MKKLVLFSALLVASSLFAASTKLSNVVLYQPDSVLRERLGDVNPLAAYVQRIELACSAAFTTEESEGVDVVVVLKPGGLSRVWFVSSLAKMPDRSKLKQEIEAIVVPAVRSGPVVFALSYDLNGFTHRMPEAGKFQPPIPAEWSEKVKGVKGPLMVPDGFISYVWPDQKTEPNQAPEPTPTAVTPPAGRLRQASPGETQEARQP